MDEELVGLLQDEGLSDGEIEDMMSPMDRYEGHASAAEAPPGTAGDDLHEAVRTVLTAARDARQPPGPQKAVEPGAAIPPGKSAKAVRVDTVESYRPFKRAMESHHESRDIDLDDLSEQADYEMGLGDSGRAPGGSVGPAGDQSCILCGSAGAGSAVCGDCRGRNSQLLTTVLGFGERGSAADIYGLFDRGYASQDITVLGYTARQMEMLGYTARQMELLGYTARQMELIGDVAALEEPEPGEDQEEVPLSFASPLDAPHITAWKHGQNLYSSIRLTGWDGAPRILTAAAPYGKAMGVVVGIMERANIAPAVQLAVMDPLARQLGASVLIPRLAAASPAVLGLARRRSAAPFLTAAVPAR